MITSKDVALKAGVSVSTVSRVFSNPELISEKVRERVLAVANELNYVPDVTASNLKTNKRNTYGVIISDSDNPFYIKVIRELNALPINKDMKTFILFSEENSETEYADIVSLISSKVQAILFTPTSEANEKIESLLSDNEIPALQLYRQKFENIDSLVIDDEYGTYLAAKTLIEHGHRDIVLFDYDLSIPTRRDIGYIKAFEEAQISFSNENIIKFKFNESIDETITKVLKEKRHTAIIPTGAEMTHTLYRCISELGLKVKDDISIIAYDDIEMAKYLGLSAISHPFKEIASTAQAIISKRISNSNIKPQHKVLKPFLVNRDSVKDI